MKELWADKHRPAKPADIVGHGKAVEQAVAFVRNFRPGRAMMIAGPAGSGKSSIVEVVAAGATLIRLNASDRRAEKDVDAFVQTTKTRSLFGGSKVILVDELEALSGGDRGGVPAMVKLVKESRFPVFLITSDAYIQKLAPLREVSEVVKLTKVPAPSAEKRLKDICVREGIAADDEAIKALVRFSQGDLRSAITDLQTATSGKGSLQMADMESIGFRDRESSIFDTLPKLFHSSSMAAASKTLSESDKPPEELFLWVESNAQLEYEGLALAQAMDIVARADVFLSRIKKQRNYRFQRYMLDMLAGLATVAQSSPRYVQYRPPDTIMLLARSRFRRSIMKSLCRKIGAATHSSEARVRRDHLPYLKLAMQSVKDGAIQGVTLSPEEMEMLRA